MSESARKLSCSVYLIGNSINPWHNNLKSQQLLSLARLAHKYQGDKLLAECVNRLKVEFPTKLVEFQKLYPPHQIPSIINGRTTLAQNIHDFIALVNGALELDIECILPCAYYLLLVTFTPEVRSTLILIASFDMTFRVADPSLLPCSWLQDLTDLTIGADSTKAVLSPTAQRALLLGYSRIYPALLKSFQRWLLPEDTTWPWWCREEYEEVVYHWSMNPYDQGEKPQPPECRQDFDAIRLRIVQYLCHDHNCTPLLLSSCTQDEYYSDIFDGLCDSCRRKEREFRDMPQQEFWCTMPAVFGMGKAWKDLKYY